MTTTRAVQHALLRARELCLVGEYDQGISEFCAVKKTLGTQLCGLAHAREFLDKLEHEYRTIVEYRTSLETLAIVSQQVQKTYRCSKVAGNNRRQQPTERTAKAIIGSVTNAAAGKKVKTMESQSRNLRRTKVPVVVRRSQRQVPLWMHRGKPRAPELSRARQLYQTQKSAAKITTRSSGSSLDNQTRKDVRRGGSLTTARTNVNQRKTRRDPQSQSAKRRESAQSAASSNSNGVCQDLIAGKMKYSELARENGWVDQELIEIIERDIVDHGEKITFENVAGLEHIKQLLQETVMLPQMAPHLFTDGLLKPCNGILMFGPPGTGKTLLAKAVAHECKTTFFNVSASTLSSKYRGDSEKLVRILFDMARYYEPSIIFMDEIDAIASTRGAVTEHEASRRVKTELLVQLSGVTSMEHNGGQVMLLAATNFPWELDEAMRRRLTKRVYIPLPGNEARRTLFELNLWRIDVSKDVKLDNLVQDTEGYSGDDITNVCETAKRMPVKRVYTPELLLKMRRDMEAGEGHREFEIERLVVTKADFVEALSNVSKSVGHDQLRRYEEWEAEFGSK
uniref:Katanin p60 ATPase-containing subunit A1 n=1 Tax=Peronospora matthiolae TaxID=2874970 RepID=A0AAV1UQ83_9STRA